MQLAPGAGYTGAASLTITTDDLGATGSGGSRSDTDVVALTFIAAAVPVVTLPGAAQTFTENGADLPVDGALTISDGDSVQIVSAQVTISGNYRAGEDRLVFANQFGITGVWNATLDRLTLTGTATVTDYQSALRTVAYRNTSDAPFESPRTIAFVVNDGAGNSVVVSTTVNVTAVNDPPVLSVPAGQTTLEDAPLVFSSALGNAITIADPDAGLDGAQITLVASSGTFTLARTTGLGFGSGANGTGSMAISGTVADLNAALDGLVFQPAANASGAVTLQFDATDFGNYGTGGTLTDSASVAVGVTPVNDAPTGSDASATIAEDGTHTFTPANFALADAADMPVDALSGLLITSLPGAGTLRLGATAVVAGQFVTVASVAAGDLVFAPAANANGAAYASFSFRVRDEGGTTNSGIDTAVSANAFVVNVTAANDAPTATGIADAETYVEDEAFALMGIVVADVDAEPLTVSLTLSDASAGTLVTATSGAVTSTFAGGVWSATGAVSNINALLAAITFQPGVNYAQDFTIAVSVSDGIAAALTATKAVTAIVANDAPVLVLDTGVSLAEGGWVVISNAQSRRPTSRMPPRRCATSCGRCRRTACSHRQGRLSSSAAPSRRRTSTLAESSTRTADRRPPPMRSRWTSGTAPSTDLRATPFPSP